MHRMSEWNDRMIAFMDDASSYGSYFQALSGELSQFIDRNQTVCDAGCGIGQLTFSLSPYVKKITGIDKSESAIGFCKEKRHVSELSNVDFRCADFSDLKDGVLFEVMVFNYFGRMEQIMEIARRHCLSRVIIIKKNYTEHRFSIGKNPIEEQELCGADKYLEREKIAHTQRLFSHEFGQPFRSIEDAVEFFSIYSRDSDKSVVNTENVQSKLVKTTNPVFPFYLPHVRNSRIYIINMKEVPR